MKYSIFLSESYVKVQDIQLHFDNIDRHKSEVVSPIRKEIARESINIKRQYSQWRNSHYKDKTVLRPIVLLTIE